MKVSCILASFNRPNYIQQALKSVAEQTHRDFELIVVDDSTVMDVRRLVDRFSFPSVHVMHFDVTPQERATANRLGVNINYGLSKAKGDLVCYLADDDYYFKDWFAQANEFFVAHPDVVTGFGSLFYSSAREMDFSMRGIVRFPDSPVTKPAGKLDHNQVMHRMMRPPLLWSESADSVKESDGIFFSDLSRKGSFHPIYATAAVKRLHNKNLQDHIDDLQNGKLENLRD